MFLKNSPIVDEYSISKSDKNCTTTAKEPKIKPSVWKNLDVNPIFISVLKLIWNDLSSTISASSVLTFMVFCFMISEIDLMSSEICFDTALISTSVSLDPAVSIWTS